MMDARSHYLYVTPFFPSPTEWRGGYCYDFVKTLQRVVGTRLRVVVFVAGNGPDYQIDGIEVYRFPVRMLPSMMFPLLFRRWNSRSFLAAVARAGISLKDVAVCHGNTSHYAIYPLVVKNRNPTCRSFLHHHDLRSFMPCIGLLRHCWLHNMILFPQFRRLHEQMDCHVFLSETSRMSFLAAPNTQWTSYADYRKSMRGLPYRAARIRQSTVLYNGVDSDRFFPQVSPQHSPDKFVIGCVGNFIDLKGQDILIRAVAKLNDPQIVLRFIGTGPTRGACEALIQDLGVRAEFLPECRHEDLPQFYWGLDLFVLPSSFEGFGCVYTEAYACGVPYICCQGQGASELTPTQWMVRTGDVEQLSSAISDMKEKRRKEINMEPLRDEYRIVPLVERFAKEMEFV